MVLSDGLVYFLKIDKKKFSNPPKLSCHMSVDFDVFIFHVYP